MRRFLLTMLTALLSVGLYAQVGINTEDPKASLDIVANTVSKTANGLLVPRLTADEVQTMEAQVGDDQNALLVYVTATFTASPTDARYTDMDAIGYYYYDAKDNTPNGKWKKLGSNPYTAGAGIQIGSGTISATGLERSVVSPTNATIYNDYYAWSLIGRDKQVKKGSSYVKPQYLPLGLGAVDVSHGEEWKTQSPTGASGQFSFASGEATTASGYASTAMGGSTTASGGASTAMGVYTTASGRASTAMGWRTTASGRASTAMGWRTTASGTNSIAMGEETTASGTNSVAMGNRTKASGTNSIAMGGEYDSNTNTSKPAKALGTTSLAFGRWAEAQADYSIAMGWGESATDLTQATGEYAIAMGNSTTASGTASTAMGGSTIASGDASTAMGNRTIALGTASTAMGNRTIALGTTSTAMGVHSTASGAYSTAMGVHNTASGDTSTAMGNRTIASGGGSTAMGERTTASGIISTAMGKGTTASGTYSTAMGYETIASGESSVAMGGEYDGSTKTSKPARALGTTSLAFGRWVEAEADHSIAMGWGDSATYLTKALSEYAVAIGYVTTASGTYSVAMGAGSKALGDTSTAMGFKNIASGDGSTAMGAGTTASGDGSTAMGAGTTASGDESTAMGRSNTASGRASTAMGERTTASGISSVAMGKNTIAPYENSIAMGTYNATPTDALLMVGNGTNNTDRKNALTVYRNGDIEAKAIYTNNGGSSDKVVTVDSSGKLKSVAKSSVGKTYTSGTGITVNNSANTISMDSSLKSQIEYIYKRRLVNSINDINKRSDRTRITGTVGYWYKSGNNWYYTGEVYIIASANSNNNEWLYQENGMVFKLTAGFNTDYKGTIQSTGTYITSIDTVVEVSTEWNTYINGNSNSTTLSGRGIRVQWGKGGSEIQSAYIRASQISGTWGSAQFLVRPVLQRWFYDE